MNWTKSKTDPSRAYFADNPPFRMCWTGGEPRVFTLSRNGELLVSGTREACEDLARIRAMGAK